MGDLLSGDLFATSVPGAPTPGSLGCRTEIAAEIAAALRRAAARGLTRELVARRMTELLGEAISESVLDGFASFAHERHEINLRRAIAFDAAVGEDCLIALYARRLGRRRVITEAEAAYIELGRIHQAERDLAERRKALQAMLKLQKA